MGQDLAVVAFVLIAGLLIRALIGAVILRGAAWMYNAIARTKHSTSSVPEPGFENALGIVLITTLANLIMTIGIGYWAGEIQLTASRIIMKASSNGSLLHVLSMPFALLLTARTLSIMLPTTFLRSLLVALCELAITIAVALAVTVVVIAVLLAMVGLGALA